MQSFYVKDKVLSDRAKNYIIREMIKMTERELSTVPYGEFNKSDYRWIIGENVASAIFVNHPTRILDFDVEYKPSQIFDPNGIDFIKRPEIKKVVCHLHQDTKRLVGDLQNGYFYVDAETAYKIEESKCRAKEMDVLDTFDPNWTSKCIKDSMEYNEMYIKKEDKKMDIKLYECGMFTGGVITNPQDLIKNVVFSGPCTIVQWSDGDKTIVRCENEDFDHEKGLAMAIVKKLFGTNETKSNYNNIFKKWCPEDIGDEIFVNTPFSDLKKFLKRNTNTTKTHYYSVKTYSLKFGIGESRVRRMCREGVLNAKKQGGAWIISIEED